MTEETIKAHFATLTGFQPRQFQQETIAAILSGQNILLRAPTGAGKTETAIAPFLFANVMGISDFPNKLIYIVPLRTLATSLRDRVERYVRAWETHYPTQRPLIVTLQTGENPEDPRFEGDIIFCTIDQLLSSFLSIPYSVGRGSANVNAGVVFASYLVFDELHLLDPDRSFATTLELLKQVQGISPFLLMTATLTEELAAQIRQEIRSLTPQRQLFSDVIHLMNIAEADLQLIETRQRYFEPIASALSASTILEDIQTHQRKRVIVLCNTVAQAQGLFQTLRDRIQDLPIQLSLLHSRFLPSDRKQKEENLKQTFGKDGCQINDGYFHILISTQVIEAGIDITCDVMHTMLCPMNALLQRAGRCARFAHQVGHVKVYRQVQVDDAFALASQSEEDDDQVAQLEQRPRRKFLPYEDSVCELTWDVLQQHAQSLLQAQPVGFETEAQWVNQVHQEDDQKQAQKRQENRKAFDDRFREAVFLGERSAANDLIRHVDNRSIYMVEEQPAIDLDLPEVNLQGLEAFSLPRTTLLKIFREFQESHSRGWIFKEIVQPEKTSEGYSLPVARAITDQRAITTSLRLLVNPCYADYDDEIGLRIGVDVEGNYLSQTKAVSSRSQEYVYHMDTYTAHLGRIWMCWNQPFPLTHPTYQSMREEQLKAGGRFLRQKFFPQASQSQTEALFEFLVFLAVVTHDLGKLQIQWQSVMRGWQAIAHQFFNGSDPKNQLIAHTDYDPTDRTLRDDKGRSQKDSLKDYEKQHSRPPHAIESAFLAYEILGDYLIPVLENIFQADTDVADCFHKVIEMAAGRHHSAQAKGWESDTIAALKRDPVRRGKLHLHKKANEAIARSWKQLLNQELAQILLLPPDPPRLSQQVYSVDEIELNCFNPDQMKYQQLYWLVVRGLRICDGRSVQI